MQTSAIVPWCETPRILRYTPGLRVSFLTSSSCEAISLWKCGPCGPIIHPRITDGPATAAPLKNPSTISYVVALWLRMINKLNAASSVGCWRWCRTFELADFLDFFHRVYWNIIRYIWGELFRKKQTWKRGPILPRYVGCYISLHTMENTKESVYGFKWLQPWLNLQWYTCVRMYVHFLNYNKLKYCLQYL